MFPEGANVLFNGSPNPFDVCPFPLRLMVNSKDTTVCVWLSQFVVQSAFSGSNIFEIMLKIVTESCDYPVRIDKADSTSTLTVVNTKQDDCDMQPLMANFPWWVHRLHET